MTAMSFLGYWIETKPPLSLEWMLRLTLNDFYCSSET